MLSGLTQKIKKVVILINNEQILNSMLAAGIVPECRIHFLEKLEKAREAKRRRLEATSTAQAWNSCRFLATEFLSQVTNTRMCIRNVRTYNNAYNIKN